MIQKLATDADLVTYEQFCFLVPDGQKADLIDGTIYMASPDSTHANEINKFLVVLMDSFIAVKGIAGEVRMSRVACRLSRLNAPEPDVLYLRPERAHLIEEGQVNGAPDFAGEIVARESRQRDYSDKRTLYESAGVEEYWIIDPLGGRCEFLRLTNGRYEPVSLEQDRIFRSNVISGFWLDTDWLLALKIPKAYDCLQLILSQA